MPRKGHSPEQVLNNSLDVARLLLEHGADIEARDKYGHTPLHDAAVNNSLEVATLLINCGAGTMPIGQLK